jgi:hypothetical protein
VHVNDVAADSEAETAPVAGALGRESAIEDAGKEIGRDAGSCVGHLDLDGLLLITPGRSAARADADSPGVGDCVGSVDENVQQHAVKRIRIAPHRRQRLVDIELDVDLPLLEHCFELRPDVPYRRIQIDQR